MSSLFNEWWQFENKELYNEALFITYSEQGGAIRFAMALSATGKPFTYCVQGSKYNGKRYTESVFGYGYSFEEALSSARGMAAEHDRKHAN